MLSTQSSRAVKLANKASSARLADCLSSSYDFPSRPPCRLQVMHNNDLKKTHRDAIWDIFELNMRSLYEDSSFGWDPQSKRKELFHALSRYLFVSEGGSTELLAFVHFRFEVEEDENVLYCYDIQIKPSAQGLGLGRRLLDELAKLGSVFRMEKILLTVLKKNTRAIKFYEAVGFSVDPTSPGYLESDEELIPENAEADYEILSKQIMSDVE
ncbi:acyl-CoA N-acyltransferase [Agrocybe pediades]|nr:acyl-CoA N-acyltransferase [Agrocybe pediades]